MRFSDLPIDRPVATLMLLISLTVLGTVAVFRLPLSFMPLVERPAVQINVNYPGSHPLENLEEVVRPIEEEVAGIPEVKQIRSEAGSDSAWIRVNFDWSVNLDLKKMEIREAVERVKPELPREIGHIRVEGFTGGPGGGGSAILLGRISANRDLSESWGLLDRKIRRPLERIRGVARVDLGGVQPQEVRIDLDPVALKKHGVQPGDVISSLGAANLDMDLGSIHGDVLRYDVRSIGRFRSLKEIATLTLGDQDVRVRDVATVSFREPDLPYGRHLDRDFAISIEVFKEPTANTVDTADRLLVRIDEIRQDPELQGITLLVWNNSGEEIRRSLAGLRNAGFVGGVLAILILFFFLRRVRTTLIVAAAIPFSLLVTCGVMYLIGSELNVLTMLGLMFGVGMLVDNAVVVIENIHRKEGQGMEAREAARIGAREVSLAVLASTATTIIVWSWLFVSGKSELTIYMGAVAMTICLAVACSLLISLTFIPLAAARFVPRKEVKPGFLLRQLVPGYRSLLGWTLHHRFLTLTGLLLLAGTAAIPIYFIEKTDQPKFRERAVAIMYQPVGPVTKEIMEGWVNQVETWVESMRGDLGYESMYSFYHQRGWGLTQLYVPYEMATEENLNRIREKLRPGLPVIPGVKLEIGERMWGGMRSQGKRFVSVALHGEDPEYLREIALEVEGRLRGVEGSKEVFGPTLRGQQEARILVDPEKARALGVTPRRIADTVAFSYRGRNLRRFPGKEGELEMILGLPEDLKLGIGSLSDLRIPRDEGDTIPLGSVAEVLPARIDNEINREDRQTTTWVSVEFDEKVTTPEGKKRVTARLKGLQLPEGYSWDWGGWGRNRDEGLGTMFQGLILSLLVVILLMTALFESFSQPLAILITLPLAFFGGFWALWMLGYILDTVAFMGVVILIGIVVNNGIVMVDHVNNLRRGGMDRVEALLQGCGDRLRPVLMTAITTIFGLIPLSLSTFTVANAYIDSLAVVVIGGLATSTLFTLLALPVWYATVEDIGSVFLRALPRWSGRRTLPASPGSVLAEGVQGPTTAT